jgi:hypothetical protein
MTGSGAILGLITTDSAVTGPLTTKPVAREVTGTVTTETATRGTTIDTGSPRKCVGFVFPDSIVKQAG